MKMTRGRYPVADDLSEYLRAKDPGKAELAGIWRAAIGLQKVDGLTPSAYLVETARRNIEGEITVAEAGNIIGEYYKSKKIRAEAAKTRTDEADIVSQRIAAILAEPTFSFSPASYVAIHRKLFVGVQARWENPRLQHHEKRMGAEGRHRALRKRRCNRGDA